MELDFPGLAVGSLQQNTLCHIQKPTAASGPVLSGHFSWLGVGGRGAADGAVQVLGQSSCTDPETWMGRWWSWDPAMGPWPLGTN